MVASAAESFLRKDMTCVEGHPFIVLDVHICSSVSACLSQQYRRHVSTQLLHLTTQLGLLVK